MKPIVHCIQSLYGIDRLSDSAKTHVLDDRILRSAFLSMKKLTSDPRTMDYIVIAKWTGDYSES